MNCVYLTYIWHIQENIAVCKPVTIFHTADQGVLAPEVRQSVTD